MERWPGETGLSLILDMEALSLFSDITQSRRIKRDKALSVRCGAIFHSIRSTNGAVIKVR